jgi:hypothetical protein
LIVVCATLGGSWVNTGFAQSALERLEQQIRQRSPQAAPGDAASERLTKPSSPVDTARSKDPPYIGLMGDDQNDRGRGVRVLTVTPGSPAEKAGIRRQDLITGMTGVRVRQMSDLADLLSSFSAGQATTIEILRDGKKQTVKLTFGRRTSDSKPPLLETQPSQSAPVPLLSTVPGSSAGLAEAASPASPSSAEGDRPESIPAPPAELLPEPPEEPGGPVLCPAETSAPTAEATPLPVAKTAASTKVEKPLPKTAEAPPSDAQRIEQLEKRVQILEKRIAELERALAEAKKTQ